MAGRIENLKPWKPGQSGNLNGRPRKSAITDAIHDLMGSDYPADRLGRTYAEVIAFSLVKRAVKGDVRAIKEIADRTEGKSRQAMNLDVDGLSGLAEGITAARRRAAEVMTDEEIEDRIRQLKSQLGVLPDRGDSVSTVDRNRNAEGETA